jgi:hypothetical protein
MTFPGAPENFDDLNEWRFNDDQDSPGHELVRDWTATWETGWLVDELGLRDFDEWAGVSVGYSDAEGWWTQIEYTDGATERIELGEEGWSTGWDLYDIADSPDNDLYADRDDVDYNSD